MSQWQAASQTVEQVHAEFRTVLHLATLMFQMSGLTPQQHQQLKSAFNEIRFVQQTGDLGASWYTVRANIWDNTPVSASTLTRLTAAMEFTSRLGRLVRAFVRLRYHTETHHLQEFLTRWNTFSIEDERVFDHDELSEYGGILGDIYKQLNDDYLFMVYLWPNSSDLKQMHERFVSELARRLDMKRSYDSFEYGYEPGRKLHRSL